MYPYLGDYYKYKKIIPFPFWLKGCRFTKQKSLLIYFFQDYEWENELRFVRIFFDTATFDRIEKDRAAKFVDQLSAIGGTMGLLTGFSIISGVEILYFAAKIMWNNLKKRY